MPIRTSLLASEIERKQKIKGSLLPATHIHCCSFLSSKVTLADTKWGLESTQARRLGQELLRTWPAHPHSHHQEAKRRGCSLAQVPVAETEAMVSIHSWEHGPGSCVKNDLCYFCIKTTGNATSSQQRLLGFWPRAPREENEILSS